MSLKILGSAGSSPSGHRACSSYLLDDRLLLDAGPGSYMNLMRSKSDPNKIKKIFLSHLHGDHIFDVGAFIWGMATWERKDDLLIYGPAGTSRFVNDLLLEGNTPSSFVRFSVRVIEFGGGEKIGEIMTAKGSHTIDDIAYRIDGLCYSGDTMPTHNIVDLAKGCKALLYESSFRGGNEQLAHKYGHSTATEAAKVALDSGVEELILTHFYPLREGDVEGMINDVTPIFPRKVMFASDLSDIII